MSASDTQALGERIMGDDGGGGGGAVPSHAGIHDAADVEAQLLHALRMADEIDTARQDVSRARAALLSSGFYDGVGDGGCGDGSSDGERRLSCDVCMENPKNVVMLPCRHMGVCAECAARIRDQALARNAKMTCPTCRGVVTETMEIFTT